MSFPSGLKAFAEKLADGLMGGFLNTIIYLSLSLLRHFILNFCHYNYKVSWCEPLWADLVYDSLCFLDLDAYFPSWVRKIVSYYVFRKATCPFLSLLLLGTLIMWMSICLMLPWDLLYCPHFLLLKIFFIWLEWFPQLCLPADSFSALSFLCHLCITTKSF